MGTAVQFGDPVVDAPQVLGLGTVEQESALCTDPKVGLRRGATVRAGGPVAEGGWQGSMDVHVFDPSCVRPYVHQDGYSAVDVRLCPFRDLRGHFLCSGWGKVWDPPVAAGRGFLDPAQGTAGHKPRVSAHSVM